MHDVISKHKTSRNVEPPPFRYIMSHRLVMSHQVNVFNGDSTTSWCIVQRKFGYFGVLTTYVKGRDDPSCTFLDTN